MTIMAGSANAATIIDDFSVSALQIAAAEDSASIWVDEGCDEVAGTRVSDLNSNSSELVDNSLLDILHQQVAGDYPLGSSTTGSQGGEQTTSAPVALPENFTEPPVLDLVTWLQAGQWLDISPAPALELLRPPQVGLLAQCGQASTIVNA